MTALREHDVDTRPSLGQPWDAAEGALDSLPGDGALARGGPDVLTPTGKPDDARGYARLEALRSYLRQMAQAPSLRPGEEIALCREIEAAHRALAAALLAVPAAAQRLRALCATVRRGATAGDDRPADAGEIVEALGLLSRARSEAVARARVNAAVAGRRIDGSQRQELMASIERSMSVMSFRSSFIEELAAEIVATAGRADVQPVECCFQRLRDLKLRLLAANAPLVVSEAVRYRHPDVSLFELVQEGNAGLRKAVDRFEYRDGFEFSTYATWWIRQAIRRALRRHETQQAVA